MFGFWHALVMQTLKRECLELKMYFELLEKVCAKQEILFLCQKSYFM